MSRFLIKVVRGDDYYGFKMPKKLRTIVLDGGVYWAERIGQPKMEEIFEEVPYSNKKIMAIYGLSEPHDWVENRQTGEKMDKFPRYRKKHFDLVSRGIQETNPTYSVIVRDKNNQIIKILSSCQYTFVENHKEQSKVLN